MRKKSKKYIKILAWIDILFGLCFILLGTLSFILVYLDLMALPEVKIGFGTYILSLMLPVLLLLSGFTLIKSRKKLKCKDYLTWASIGIGSCYLINTVLTLFISSGHTKGIVLLGLLFEIASYVLLAIDGFYLREI